MGDLDCSFSHASSTEFQDGKILTDLAALENYYFTSIAWKYIGT